ncbi:MAG: 16S rRNA (cytidine1402-2'-O)-methyltransferase [Flavobacteriales bacterium]|jgi:16S rRNA (cytidine1402-2'-O)-methyltransferase
MSKGQLYLLPMTLGESEHDMVIPKDVQALITRLDVFIVENIKTTRRYLRKLDREFNIDDSTFFELNKHTQPQDIASFLAPIEQGKNVGIISEAGVPAVADPGADVVAIAHQKGYKVIPLVGPSSILMGLMGSGFNGQKFTFNGYLSKEKSDRIKNIKFLEQMAQKGVTQIFMETPFRNQSLLEDLLKTCNSNTKLCIATEISTPEEIIVTKTISEWNTKVPNVNKKQVIFVIG